MTSASFRITSRRTGQYNCVAWAAGSNERWWDPSPGYHWPAAARQGIFDELVVYFKSIGFAEPAAAESEPGIEKIAIYERQGDYSHVARQLSNGKWSSKLGSGEDIEHDSLASLEGENSAYGRVAVILKRAIQEAPPRTQQQEKKTIARRRRGTS